MTQLRNLLAGRVSFSTVVAMVVVTTGSSGAVSPATVAVWWDVGRS